MDGCRVPPQRRARESAAPGMTAAFSLIRHGFAVPPSPAGGRTSPLRHAPVARAASPGGGGKGGGVRRPLPFPSPLGGGCRREAALALPVGELRPRRCRWQMQAGRNFRSRAVGGSSERRPGNGIRGKASRRLSSKVRLRGLAASFTALSVTRLRRAPPPPEGEARGKGSQGARIPTTSPRTGLGMTVNVPCQRGR